MSLSQLEAKFRLNDMERIRQCLPAHMMELMVEQAQKTCLAVRADVLKHLNNAAAAPLARLDYQNVSRLAKRIDDAARTLLRDLSPDNPVEGLYCCAMFVMVLVDEGYLQDRQNMAVLVALLLMTDVRDQETDVNGERPLTRLNEERWRLAAKKLLNRALITGLFERTVQ